MRPIAVNVYILMLLIAYVMQKTGKMSMEHKVKILEFISQIAVSPDVVPTSFLSLAPCSGRINSQ